MEIWKISNLENIRYFRTRKYRIYIRITDIYCRYRAGPDTGALLIRANPVHDVNKS